MFHFAGVFGTVEMRPAIVGTWLIECTIGEHQMAGMRAKMLVYNPRKSFSQWEIVMDPVSAVVF